MKNTLRLGGNQSVASSVLRLDGVAAQSGPLLDGRKLSTDSQPVISIGADGAISVGSGGASTVDTVLSRDSAGNWLINGGLVETDIGTPSAPGSGKAIIYFKSDNLPYFRAGAAGSETAFGAGGTASFDPVLNAAFMGGGGRPFPQTEMPQRRSEIATPAAPGANYGILYFKSDDLPYFRAGAGAETALAVGTPPSFDPVLGQALIGGGGRPQRQSEMPARVSEITTPQPPGTNYGIFYFKSDDLPYFRAGSGAETAIATGTATASFDPVLTQAFGR